MSSFDAADEAAGGAELTLAPVATPRERANFAAKSLLALGIVAGLASWVFYLFFFDDWLAGRLGCLPATAYALLILLGLLALPLCIVPMLALANPRPYLAIAAESLERGRLELGSELVLHLRWTGAVSRLRWVRVELEAVEVCNPASPKTGRGLFVQETLLDEAAPVSESHELCAVLADDGLPTSEGRYGYVAWEIRVHGSMGRWPDVREAYVLDVHTSSVNR